MTTLLMAVVALSGPLAPAAKPEFSAQTDYGQAMKVAANEKKPIVVLIGKGDQFAKLMADKDLTAEAKKLLTEKYVCVTVDVTTDAGKNLAGQFQMTDGGLVISSAGGSYQAFRQTGTVTATDLSKQAATYATVSATPNSTTTAGTVSGTTTYVPSNPVIQSGYTPSYAPSSPPTFAPSTNYFQPSFGAPRCVGGT
jgi:hypothetical protein